MNLEEDLSAAMLRAIVDGMSYSAVAFITIREAIAMLRARAFVNGKDPDTARDVVVLLVNKAFEEMRCEPGSVERPHEEQNERKNNR